MARTPKNQSTTSSEVDCGFKFVDIGELKTETCSVQKAIAARWQEIPLTIKDSKLIRFRTAVMMMVFLITTVRQKIRLQRSKRLEKRQQN